MSGHSKWHSIKHKKGAADARRGKVFTRIIKELTVAARDGGGDPDSNPRLRTVVADAKAANMPADNIKRAIRRGTGEEPGVSYEEVTYEAYGPGGAALLIEVLTDNTNRAVGEIRHLLSKHGGNLGTTNSVAWLFAKHGHIIVDQSGVDEDAFMTAVIDGGADDIRDDDDHWEVVTSPETYESVLAAVKEAGVEPAGAQLAMLPQNYVKLEGAPARQILKLMDLLEDHDDVRATSGPTSISTRRRSRRHWRENPRGRPRLQAHRLRLHRNDRQPAPPHRLRPPIPRRCTLFLPDKLLNVHSGLAKLLAAHKPGRHGARRPVLRPQCALRADPGSCARRADARGRGGRRSGGGVLPGRGEAGGGGVRPRRQAAGAADGDAAARP